MSVVFDDAWRRGLMARLKEAIAGVGTQAEVAEQLGMTRQTITHYITKEPRISLEVAARLCALTGRSLDWLALGSPDDMQDGRPQDAAQREVADSSKERIYMIQAALAEELVARGYDGDTVGALVKLTRYFDEKLIESEQDARDIGSFGAELDLFKRSE